MMQSLKEVPLAENKPAGKLAGVLNVLAALLAIPVAGVLSPDHELLWTVLLTGAFTTVSAVSASVTENPSKRPAFWGVAAIIVGVLMHGDFLTLPVLQAQEEVIGLGLRVLGAVLTAVGYPVWRPMVR
jgi:fluoride ion exporter CrcB/FEX